MENKEKQIISATEPRTTFIPVESYTRSTICQRCLLCENIREFINGYPPGPNPWVCDECREAIAFVKEFRAGIKEVPADKAKEIEASMALL
jgi:hypothetical protein